MNAPRSAGQRTLLANDRTLLAWYRTAFGAYALAIGVGRVVPQLAKSTAFSYRVIGVMFAVLGATAPLGGIWEHAVSTPRARPPTSARRAPHFVVAFGVLSSLLGLVIAVLIASSS